jgi:hypothetical protein
MSNQAIGPAVLPSSSGAASPSMEDQLAKLTSDVDHLKKESKSWVKTWGVYLGVLGALVALPKGIMDLTTQFWHSPVTSVAIREVTIYHDPGLSSEIVKVPLVVTNVGNFDDALLNHGATLTVAGRSVDVPDADFGLFDSDGKKVDTSLYVPKGGLRAYDVSITFNTRTREVAATPGPHKLELRFLGTKNESYLASFCFPLQDSEIRDLFESTMYKRQTMITQCTGS